MMKYIKNNPIAQIVLLVIGLLLGFRLYKKFVSTGSKIGSGIKNSLQNIAISDATNKYNISPVRVTELSNIAQSIYDALHKNDWFGITENEEKAFFAFKEITSSNEAIVTASIYKASYSKSLYNDLKKYIGVIDGYNEFSTAFLNAIKSI